MYQNVDNVLGLLGLDSWVLMAPMAGITNLPFRIIVKRMGAALVVTEMVSSMGLVQGQKKTLRYLDHHEDEGLLAVQIFGSDPRVMGEAARIAVGESADIIDINMGCPAKKVVRTGAGGALLKDLRRISEVIRCVRKACQVPVTVKIRSGWSEASYVAEKVALIAQEEGADAITVHPRYVKQGFSGSADWSIIKRVKRAVSIPVIGNGDIIHAMDAFSMKELTGCDAVMIGRGAVKNPWIFRQIKDIERGMEPLLPTMEDYKRVAVDYFKMASSYMGEKKAALGMRNLLLRFTRGIPFSCRFREKLTEISTLNDMEALFDEWACKIRSTPSQWGNNGGK